MKGPTYDARSKIGPMNIKPILLMVVLVGLMFGGPASGVPNPQEGYSTDTLQAPVFEAAKVAVDTAAFNNWLNANHAKLTGDQLTGPREHLYYLIDSHIKHRFATTGHIMPAEHDLMLEILFSWAEPLGVYGGNMIFNAVKASAVPAREPTISPPSGMRVTLEHDLLRVGSGQDWSVAFPYYFMIWQLQEFDRTDGLRTQLMIVSTGAAKDSSSTGHSQATLMVMFSPGSNLGQFQEFWERQFEIESDSERVNLGIGKLTSQRNFEPSLKLHREIVFWENEAGAFAVSYLGNDGTYQWNRAHFLDFLRAFESGNSGGRSK